MTLRLCRTSLDGGGPARDTAASRVVLERVDAGELPATLRLSRPPRVVAFSRRDRRHPGFEAAVAAARAAGFDAVVRLAGGRPAVFTPSTIAFALAEPADDPARDIHERFAWMAGVVRDALAALGVDARIGPVPGEYCPGEWSVNAGGRRKLAGVGQRLLRRAAHTGGVIVVDDAPAVRDVLERVHDAMGIAWDPATVGSVVSEGVAASFDRVREAVVAAAAARVPLEPWPLDPTSRTRAARLEADHAVPDAGAAR